MAIGSGKKKDVGKGAIQRRRAHYEIGTHGARKAEQRFLSLQFKRNVTRHTHESEHTIGFKVLVPTIKRGTKGRASAIEKEAPAYQEARPQHRMHVGTGINKDRGGKGVGSSEYRKWQAMLVMAGDISSAVQLNQLFYASQKGFKDKDSLALKQADASFNRMARHMKLVRYDSGGRDRFVKVSKKDRLEMKLSRIAARAKQWPVEEIRAANAKLALK